jgi:hypothetical protein
MGKQDRGGRWKMRRGKKGAKSLQDIYQVSHLDFKELMDEASTPMERGIEG